MTYPSFAQAGTEATQNSGRTSFGLLCGLVPELLRQQTHQLSRVQENYSGIFWSQFTSTLTAKFRFYLHHLNIGPLKWLAQCGGTRKGRSQ
tara:strand:+ start:2503 stop:2775 length:273 start_codon:yes stop_codon:yes gene_type:complete